MGLRGAISLPRATSVAMAVAAGLITVGAAGLAREATHITCANAQVIHLEDPEIAESSGLVASASQPDVFWTLNDSGAPPRLHAFSPAGEALGTWTIEGAQNLDWEDLGQMRGPEDQSLLVIADIGDNLALRPSVSIYVVEEPEVSSTSDGVGSAAVVDIISMRWPDGPQNAEALLVHPLTGEMLLVSKDLGDAHVLTARTAPGAAAISGNRLDLSRLPLLDAVTGGAVSSDGTRMALRTVTGVFVWDVAPGASLGETLLTVPAIIRTPVFGQSEAVSFGADPDEIWMTAEGSPAALMHLTTQRVAADGGEPTGDACRPSTGGTPHP